MGGVRGFAGLSNLSRKMARMTGVDVRTAELCADPLSVELTDDFDAQRDPYGVPWPDKYTRVKSGDLRAAIALSAKGRKLKATFPKYARYQKPPLFIPAKGSPALWNPIVQAKAIEALRETAKL